MLFPATSSLAPASSGKSVHLSDVINAAGQRQIQSAKIYDQDGRVVIVNRAGQKVWASYPKSEGETSQLIDRLVKSGAQVSVDQQSGKPATQLVVQFLLPILILVTLFSLFTILAKGTGGAPAR